MFCDKHYYLTEGSSRRKVEYRSPPAGGQTLQTDFRRVGKLPRTYQEGSFMHDYITLSDVDNGMLSDALEVIELNFLTDLAKKGGEVLETFDKNTQAAARVLGKVVDPKTRKATIDRVEELAAKHKGETPLDPLIQKGKEHLGEMLPQRVKDVVSNTGKISDVVNTVKEKAGAVRDAAVKTGEEAFTGDNGANLAKNIAIAGLVPAGVVGGGAAIYHGAKALSNRKGSPKKTKKLNERSGGMHYTQVLSEIMNEWSFAETKKEEQKKKPRRGIIERLAPAAGTVGGAMGGGLRGAVGGGLVGGGLGLASGLLGKKGKALAMIRNTAIGGALGTSAGGAAGTYIGGVTGHARGQMLQKQLEENRLKSEAARKAKMHG